MAVRQRSKHELVAALLGRYRRADRAGKARLLDEFCAATGYHRKHAIRLLRNGPPPPRSGHGGRARVYSSVVVGASRLCAEASGWLCGKRLAPFLAELVPALEAEGALRLEPLARSQLLAMSAATIDRRLQPFRLQLVRGFSATKPGSLLKSQVAVRTWTPWDEQRIGFLEIDLVAHCGISNRGQFLFTLVATDVASGWTECMGVPSKRQDDVFTALEFIRGRLPFVLLGLDSDNGGEFLNSHLVQYCAQHRLTFTRSRPYWKNDQAHVELCGCPHNSTYADYAIMPTRQSSRTWSRLRSLHNHRLGGTSMRASGRNSGLELEISRAIRQERERGSVGWDYADIRGPFRTRRTRKSA
jgi:hypothetical protein